MLIATCVKGHIHSSAALAWRKSHSKFAICPFTEAALARFLLRQHSQDRTLTNQLLTDIAKDPGFEFWNADISLRNLNIERLSGPNQVTDAYLVALAEAHGGKLATFDQALATIYSGAVLIDSN